MFNLSSITDDAISKEIIKYSTNKKFIFCIGFCVSFTATFIAESICVGLIIGVNNIYHFINKKYRKNNP